MSGARGPAPTEQFWASLGEAHYATHGVASAMVYLLPPGEGHPGEVGVPLWYLVRQDRLLGPLHRASEVLPPDRRHLRGWARAVRFPQVNVEISDLGIFLEASFRVPRGGRFSWLFRQRDVDREEWRQEGVHRVGDTGWTDVSLEVPGARFLLARGGEEGNPSSP
jgi:hypothetical protein